MIRIHAEQLSDIWAKATDYCISELEKGLEEGQKTIVFLSGGSVIRIYETISRWLLVASKKRIDLSSLMAFGQVDERFQPKLNLKSGIRNQKKERRGY